MVVPIEEKLKIAKLLENSHSLFRFFWDLGEPTFTDKIPTAAVSFNADGEFIEFMFNEKFWNSLPTYDRAFIIGHEILHIVLGHGRRINDKDSDKEAANKAMDICVNDLLVTEFEFNKNELVIEKTLGSELCWYDTFFKDSKKVKKNREAEYYYNILKQLKEKGYDISSGNLLDGHLTTEESEGTGEGIDKLIKKNIEAIGKIISDDPKLQKILESFGESGDENMTFIKEITQTRGTGEGSWLSAQNKKLKFNNKWNKVIPKKDIKSIIYDFVEIETFLRKNKRLEYFLDDSILIPNLCTLENEMVDKTKVDLFMFLDVSGSCLSFIQTFYDAYKTISKKTFKIRLFSFDTKAEEIEVGQDNFTRIYGSGGTTFQCMENKIQKIMKNEKLERYPFVFVITDGYGGKVNAEFAERWHWFLTPFSNIDTIPKKSHTYKLADYLL